MREWTIEISTATALVLCSHHALYLRGCDCVDRVLHRRAAARPPEGPQRRHRGAGGRVTVPCRCVHAVMLCCQVCGVLLSPACRQADTHADRQTDRHTHTHTHTQTRTHVRTRWSLWLFYSLISFWPLHALIVRCADKGTRGATQGGKHHQGAGGAWQLVLLSFSRPDTHTGALTNDTITQARSQTTQ